MLAHFGAQIHHVAGLPLLLTQTTPRMMHGAARVERQDLTELALAADLTLRPAPLAPCLFQHLSTTLYSQGA